MHLFTIIKVDLSGGSVDRQKCSCTDYRKMEGWAKSKHKIIDT